MAVLEILKVNLLLNVDHQLLLFQNNNKNNKTMLCKKKGIFFSVVWVLMEILRA